ncbi:MAG: glycosyl hydrolase 53 family protein [Polyangiaceae bacterium]
MRSAGWALLAAALWSCSSNSSSPSALTAGAGGQPVPSAAGTGGVQPSNSGNAGMTGSSAGMTGSSAGMTGGSAGTSSLPTFGGASGGETAAIPSYFIGADITDQEPAPAAAQDNLLALLKAHGFNFIRLRTFVDPKAVDGYDKTDGYDDLAHTVAFGARIKAAGIGLLVDFHYSDNWADPGKQCIPVAWQGFSTIAALSEAVHDYTKAAITALVAGGARPDMVQIGNETTPGMLLHHCDTAGQPLTGVTIPIIGAATSAGWPNLGSLLKAGVAGVREVDPKILVSLHIDRGNDFATTKNWLDNALQQGVKVDAFGESCYQTYQGDPSSVSNTVNGWTKTFAALTLAYPELKFFAAEYGPLERQINDVLFALPNQQGLGTFAWEPTTQGDWNASQPSDPTGTPSHALVQRMGNTYTALPDLALYDPMKAAYAPRL